MPKHINKIADAGIEDIIRALANVACAEAHTKTVYEKLVSQLETGIVNALDDNELESHLKKTDNAKEQMTSLCELRRRIMQRLLDGADKANELQWCNVKHMALTANCMYEAWMASEDDAELERLYLDANIEFVKVMSDFLGYEITPCSSCFSDMLKKGKEDEQNDNDM